VLTSSANPSIMRQTVTFTATVRAVGSAWGTPAGSVDFLDTTTNIDLGIVSPTAGSASLSTSALAVGAHEIQANYGGDPNFLPRSGSLTQNVNYDFSGFLPPLSPREAAAASDEEIALGVEGYVVKKGEWGGSWRRC
jgi:hypothetical protein